MHDDDFYVDTLSELRSGSEQDLYCPFGLPVSRTAWDACHAADLFEPTSTGAELQSLYAMRRLADRVNAWLHPHLHGAEPVRPGHLITASLLTEILRHIADRYCEQENPGAMMAGLGYARRHAGHGAVDKTLGAFLHRYPPASFLLGGDSEEGYFDRRTAARPNTGIAARETLLLHVTTSNPAMSAFLALFDDAELRQVAPYEAFIGAFDGYFRTQPPVAALGMTLLDVLRAPARHSPHSLEGQIEYIRKHWASLLPAALLRRLLLARDLLREETRMRGLGPGPSQALQFDLGEYDAHEPERFTHDADWMANAVLIAKSVYVWLDQLSKKHQRGITRLDEIPDEELDRLARWGFTGLWLIGVWERSPASAEIKHRMGNPEAAASAYSLFDYEIAHDLGGQVASDNLRVRAWQRGIRLATDMVPNHVGIYSKWVIEHPDWFIQTPHSPFPGYRFTGPNLSHDPRVTIQIEDGYWNHSDAAVVFKRIDNHTGDTRYIYHGNDGTSMPWNDTAQLDYRNPEVREAVIQTILHVARMSPIIRFDAAMTLAKRHYQRLWFPRPGEGGAIPSRAECGMGKSDFDAAMPEEFWRQVVDRIQAEVPDTLLLAEAFWLMEGYFVRTLGMHRVYNSAFMNMLKLEENAKYRMTIKNVLEFSPEVLCRFVNFMNNPDELTAVEQFGRGEKYFGVCMIMVTMPGLPMFGHGQIEGFTEKYGMEYRKAYWDEAVDEGLLRHHEHAIFPLMRRRYLFSGSRDFALYDFYTPEGHVNENVFAYSNRCGHERSLIIYNNVYGETRGWVRTSTAINIGPADSPQFIHKTVGDGLGLRGDNNVYYVFRDYCDGLEYIRRGKDIVEQGLYVELGAYRYHAFLDFREIVDVDGSWGRIAGRLAGGGVASIDDAYAETVLGPIIDSFRKAMNADLIKAVAASTTRKKGAKAIRAEFETALLEFVVSLGDRLDRFIDGKPLVDGILDDVTFIQQYKAKVKTLDITEQARAFLAAPPKHAATKPTGDPCFPTAWAIARRLAPVFASPGHSAADANWLDQWHLKGVISDTLADIGWEDWMAREAALLIQTLVRHAGALETRAPRELVARVAGLFEDEQVRAYLYVNLYEGTLWINREQLESLMYWLVATQAIALTTAPKCDPLARDEAIQLYYEAAQETLQAAKDAGYQLERVLEILT